MKGICRKIEDGWILEYDEKTVISVAKTIIVHPEDWKDCVEGKEVEFEPVGYVHIALNAETAEPEDAIAKLISPDVEESWEMISKRWVGYCFKIAGEGIALKYGEWLRQNYEPPKRNQHVSV